MLDSEIVVIGVSSDKSKFGHKIFKSLAESGYKVQGVNPKGGELCGRKIYRSVGELPLRPELALIVVPPAAALPLVKECAEAGVKTFWLQPGSDSDQVQAAAEAAGMRVVRGACFMVREGVW